MFPASCKSRQIASAQQSAVQKHASMLKEAIKMPEEVNLSTVLKRM